MMPGAISKRVVSDRLAWVDRIYHEVEAQELIEICKLHLADLERIATAYRDWLRKHPERLDESL